LKGTAIRNKQGSITFISMMTILCGAVGLAVAVLVAGAAATLLPQGPNTAFGKAFAANSHKLQAKKKSRLYLSKTWCAGE
jgi:hypothetical protein